MTEEEVQSVYNMVAAYLDGQPGEGFDIGDADHFTGLVVHAEGPNFPPDKLELRVVVALCLLHREGGPPPLPLCADLLHHVQEAFAAPAAQRSRVMEIALLYGTLPERRTVRIAGWAGVWPNAVQMLNRAVEPAVRDANKWLSRHLPGFPEDRHLPENETEDSFPQRTLVRSDAAELAQWLIFPEKIEQVEDGGAWLIHCIEESATIETSMTVEDRTGTPDHYQTIPHSSKLVWRMETEAILNVPGKAAIGLAPGDMCVVTARLSDAQLRHVKETTTTTYTLKPDQEIRITGPANLAILECSCGTTSCVDRHRLASWQPFVPITLWSYIASAVKGPQRSVQTGSLQQGMYFALLSWGVE